MSVRTLSYVNRDVAVLRISLCCYSVDAILHDVSLAYLESAV